MLIDTPVNKITPCFHYELGVRQLQFETQRVVPILYKGMRLVRRTVWT